MYGIDYFPGISSEPKFVTTKFIQVVASSPCVDFSRMRCTSTQGGQGSGACASSGSVGTGSEGFDRVRCTNAQGGREVVYVWAKRIVRV